MRKIGKFVNNNERCLHYALLNSERKLALRAGEHFLVGLRKSSRCPGRKNSLSSDETQGGRNDVYNRGTVCYMRYNKSSSVVISGIPY